MKFKKEITFAPAFDKRHADPEKNYGIHGMNLGFYLTGDKGAVQFIVYTNWHLPHVTEEFINKPGRSALDIKIRYLPMAADLGYHSPKPMYEEHKPMGECSVIGSVCYYDGSTLNAEPVFDLLLKEGSEAVWNYLEKYYNEVFIE